MGHSLPVLVLPVITGPDRSLTFAALKHPVTEPRPSGSGRSSLEGRVPAQNRVTSFSIRRKPEAALLGHRQECGIARDSADSDHNRLRPQRRSGRYLVVDLHGANQPPRDA